ncbi:uncharacterized protein LOC131589530 [Poecile atricapillus]|uniref:uncharacterized protein LOC131589530 n=1 Tax=Poecile atricapillus TaxID=48891 RepID=UPI00273828B0|nr:uncharacterized protein LOC131589530 [Poecile atricapillus]
MGAGAPPQTPLQANLQLSTSNDGCGGPATNSAPSKPPALNKKMRIILAAKQQQRRVRRPQQRFLRSTEPSLNLHQENEDINYPRCKAATTEGAEAPTEISPLHRTLPQPSPRLRLDTIQPLHHGGVGTTDAEASNPLHPLPYPFLPFPTLPYPTPPNLSPVPHPTLGEEDRSPFFSFFFSTENEDINYPRCKAATTEGAEAPTEISPLHRALPQPSPRLRLETIQPLHHRGVGREDAEASTQSSPLHGIPSSLHQEDEAGHNPTPPSQRSWKGGCGGLNSEFSAPHRSPPALIKGSKSGDIQPPTPP